MQKNLNWKIIEMIGNGASTKDLMENFGFKTSTQAKMAYLNAAIDEGILPEVSCNGNSISVSRHGSISVPKKMIAEMGFKERDSFTVRKTKAGISLSLITPIEEPPKPVVILRKKRP